MSTSVNSTDFLTNFIDSAQTAFKQDSRMPANEGDKKYQERAIPVPAWIPASYLRSRMKNLYLNMLNLKDMTNTDKHLDMFEEPSGGSSYKDKIKSMLSSALASVATAVTNQVGAMANTAQGIANSFGLENDAETKPTAEDIDFLPMMYIYGFNVAPPISQSLEIIKQAWEVFKNIVSSDDGFGDYVKKIKDALVEVLKTAGLVDKENNAISVDSAFINQHGIAEKMILGAAAGTYLLEAKVPFMNNEKSMMDIEPDNNWHGGLTGSGGNGMIGNIAESTGLNMAFSPQIYWKAASLSKCSPVRTKFTLYNDTMYHTALNYLFIMAFAQSAMPVTGGITIRPPFLYDIVLPNGLKYYSCTCSLQYECKGKLRMLHRDTMALMGEMIGSKNLLNCSAENLKTRFGQLYDQKALYFPDAYEVTITFTSLLPDLWNLISGWVIDSNDVSNPKMGTEKDTLLVQMIKAFTEAMSKQKEPTIKEP